MLENASFQPIKDDTVYSRQEPANNYYANTMPNEASQVVYRNRSNSSTYYDNNVDTVDSNGGKQSHYPAQSVYKIKNSNASPPPPPPPPPLTSDKNIRNGVYIDINIIKELRAKKTKPQLVSQNAFIFEIFV